MRYITADYIFPVSSAPAKNGVVVVDDDGVIQDVLPASISPPPASIESYNGIICPGFINAHCHLELSHMKGKLSEGKGLPQFIKEIIPNRNAGMDVIEQAIADAEKEMLTKGIVGAGDICNTNHTFKQKAKGNIRYHNFIELFDLDEKYADEVFEKGKQLAKESDSQSQISNLKSQISLVPHAPYSVSTKLLKLINKYAEVHHSVLSIHNQETASENEMFLSATGELFEALEPFIGSNWKATGKNSIASALDKLHGQNKTLLVHNTYTSNEDLTDLKSKISNLKSLFWCFCPNANQYIENRLPDFQLFIKNGCKITVGTDSYASNWSLSVLDELKTIHKYDSSIPLETLLQWATLNGAYFFGWSKELGSIEKGKKPGLNLIEGVDLKKMQLTEAASVRKIT